MRPALFFVIAVGGEPVRDWLRGLPSEDRKNVGADIQALEFGEPMTLPLVRALGDGIWEVRTPLPSRRIARVLFMRDGATLVLLHGFIKKTRATPARELRLARRRKRNWEQADG